MVRSIKSLERKVKDNIKYLIKNANTEQCYEMISYIIGDYESIGINLDQEKKLYLDKLNEFDKINGN
jgi:hypothetical protein